MRCAMFLLFVGGVTYLESEGLSDAHAANKLPRNHECQRIVCAHLASLTERDLSHGMASVIDETKEYSREPDYLYRNYLATLMLQPMVGTKRAMPVINAPAATFLLSNIERADDVFVPPIWPETLAAFVRWDFPGNLALWIALMTDWTFAKKAVARVYPLRSHLILPDPDGRLTGPSHFNARLGSPASADQFAWDGVRDTAAAMVTDEALHLAPLPAADALAAAPQTRAHEYSEQIRENTRDSKGERSVSYFVASVDN